MGCDWTVKTQTLTIGRSPDSDIRIRDETVSRRHAELTVTGGGRFYVTDCCSLRGTGVSRGGTWILLRQDYVNPDERIRFGEFETKLARLLDDNSRDPKSRHPGAEAASARPQRNMAGSKLACGSVNVK